MPGSRRKNAAGTRHTYARTKMPHAEAFDTMMTLRPSANRNLDEALKIAEAVAATRHDIFTEDALAWTYFKLGRLDEAAAASARALRTGTRDEQLQGRAARIRSASGGRNTRGTRSTGN